MAYFDTKKGSLEEAIKASVGGQIAETNKNNKSDDGEGMDAVQPKAVKKKFADRKDKDLDNDGDTDASDKYLHKRRKAVSKAIKSDESFEYGTPEATENSLNMTPGQSSKEWDEQVGIMHKKQNTMRETVAKMWGVEEGHNPFKKEEEKNPKKESKTLTGKPATKVSVNSDEKKD
jgi:hypothetical protein|tara:strand:+ start:40 stop:564 length:525 start_codon:yes stop_codon:yes gene_type:complete